MANKTLRITIPENVEEQLKLSNLIYQKHQADGAISILKAMQDYNWDTMGPNLAPALAKHNEAEKLRREMEKAYKERDSLMGDVSGIIKSTRDFLKGAYSKQPKKLGDYGYTVDDTPRPSKPKPGK